MLTKEDKKIYAFNIIAEAKVQTLVILTRKVHPDWTLKQTEDFLERLLKHVIKRSK